MQQRSCLMKFPLLYAPAFVLLCGLGACTPETGPTDRSTSVAPTEVPASPATPAIPADANPTPEASDETATPASVLGLEGLGDLRIGQAPPAHGSWGERGAPSGNGACRTINSTDYPDVYAIVSDGVVQRITLGQRATVKLAEGVGVGSSEQDVMKWFAGFREQPHKYEPAPAKYLTAPNAGNGSSALRFEIGADGNVKLIHVGVMPVLAYVEGCS